MGHIDRRSSAIETIDAFPYISFTAIQARYRSLLPDSGALLQNSGLLLFISGVSIANENFIGILNFHAGTSFASAISSMRRNSGALRRGAISLL
jgi:hypothetical protein